MSTSELRYTPPTRASRVRATVTYAWALAALGCTSSLEGNDLPFVDLATHEHEALSVSFAAASNGAAADLSAGERAEFLFDVGSDLGFRRLWHFFSREYKCEPHKHKPLALQEQHISARGVFVPRDCHKDGLSFKVAIYHIDGRSFAERTTPAGDHGPRSWVYTVEGDTIIEHSGRREDVFGAALKQAQEQPQAGAVARSVHAATADDSEPLMTARQLAEALPDTEYAKELENYPANFVILADGTPSPPDTCSKLAKSVCSNVEKFVPAIQNAACDPALQISNAEAGQNACTIGMGVASLVAALQTFTAFKDPLLKGNTWGKIARGTDAAQSVFMGCFLGPQLTTDWKMLKDQKSALECPSNTGISPIMSETERTDIPRCVGVGGGDASRIQACLTDARKALNPEQRTGDMQYATFLDAMQSNIETAKQSYQIIRTRAGKARADGWGDLGPAVSGGGTGAVPGGSPSTGGGTTTTPQPRSAVGEFIMAALPQMCGTGAAAGNSTESSLDTAYAACVQFLAPLLRTENPQPPEGKSDDCATAFRAFFAGGNYVALRNEKIVELTEAQPTADMIKAMNELAGAFCYYGGVGSEAACMQCGETEGKTCKPLQGSAGASTNTSPVQACIKQMMSQQMSTYTSGGATARNASTPVFDSHESATDYLSHLCGKWKLDCGTILASDANAVARSAARGVDGNYYIGTERTVGSTKVQTFLPAPVRPDNQDVLTENRQHLKSLLFTGAK